eukprot:GHVU01116303.1.p4 GENE.GHVU01116303.1~~GHVU01116303.1.p4  ORF type:complete len:124 (+),score=14.84 GHVU01116303.1:3590-3961(+)
MLHKVAKVERTKPSIAELWRYSDLDDSVSFEEKEAYRVTGDAWPACLLRKKSFVDLHKIWFVCLKEKNKLLSERLMALQQSRDMHAHGRMKKVNLRGRKHKGFVNLLPIPGYAIRCCCVYNPV